MFSGSRLGVCAAIALAVAAGCSENDGRMSSSSSGSSRSFWDRETTVRGEHGEKLTLVRPASQSVRRGGAETMKIHLKRNGIREPVNVALTQLPAGVEAVDTPKSTDLDTVEVVLRASPSADLVTNHEVRVTATGPNGMSATETFRLTVKDRG